MKLKKPTNLSIRIETDLKESLEAIAEEEDLTVAIVLRRIIRRAVEERNKCDKAEKR